MLKVRKILDDLDPVEDPTPGGPFDRRTTSSIGKRYISKISIYLEF